QHATQSLDNLYTLHSLHRLYHTTLLFFFFTATPTTEIYTLSLHDALPISSATPQFNAVALPRLFGRITVRRLEASQAARILFVSDRKSTRLNSSHVAISYAVFCLKKKKKKNK